MRLRWKMQASPVSPLSIFRNPNILSQKNPKIVLKIPNYLFIPVIYHNSD